MLTTSCCRKLIIWIWRTCGFIRTMQPHTQHEQQWTFWSKYFKLSFRRFALIRKITRFDFSGLLALFFLSHGFTRTSHIPWRFLKKNIHKRSGEFIDSSFEKSHGKCCKTSTDECTHLTDLFLQISEKKMLTYK